MSYAKLSDDERASRRAVTLGCKVMVRDSNGKTRKFKYDYVNGLLPSNIPDFEGKFVGDSFEFMGEKYTIDDISI
jgi:hypothetical protein